MFDLSRYIISALVSSSSTMFRNDTDHAVEVMEGIEGVCRSLGSIPPHKDFPVRSAKTYCTYAVFPKVPDTELKEVRSMYSTERQSISAISKLYTVIPSNRLLSSGTVQIIRRDNGIVDVKEEPSESGEVQAPVNRTRGRFQRCIEGFSKFSLPVKSPKECSLGMDPVVAKFMHFHEIESFHWIKYSGDTWELSSVRARTALELWKSKEKVFKLKIDSFEAELKDCDNQIFQWLIGFYTVVHGVLFTVVSQPDSPFTCGKIHISYILSAITSFFTIVGVVQKLKPTEFLNEVIYEQKARLLAVCTWQSNLKRLGREFEYGTAALNYKPRPVTTWWPPNLLPFKAVKYIFVIVMCSAVLCYIMYSLKCN